MKTRAVVESGTAQVLPRSEKIRAVARGDQMLVEILFASASLTVALARQASASMPSNTGQRCREIRVRFTARAQAPEIADVEALSDGYAWAVGSYINGLTLPAPWTAHWDGTDWRFKAVPGGPNAIGSLDGVAGVKGTTLTFAVGSTGFNPLIYAWNGREWATSYFGPSGSGAFLAVTMISSSDAWAVGHTGGPSDPGTPFTAHWNGSQWTPVSAPLPRGYAGGQLYGVAAVNGSDVWAVGSLESGTLSASLWEHWNGHRWTAHAEFPTSGGPLSSVAAVPRTNTLWAVGYRSDGSTLTERFDGTAFTLVPSLNPFADNYLIGAAAFNAADVWAVGDARKHGSEAFHPLIEQWDGSAWQVVANANVGNVLLLKAAAIPGTSRIWAVGIKYDPYSGPFTEQCLPRT